MVARLSLFCSFCLLAMAWPKTQIKANALLLWQVLEWRSLVTAEAEPFDFVKARQEPGGRCLVPVRWKCFCDYALPQLPALALLCCSASSLAESTFAPFGPIPDAFRSMTQPSVPPMQTDWLHSTIPIVQLVAVASVCCGWR